MFYFMVNDLIKFCSIKINYNYYILINKLYSTLSYSIMAIIVNDTDREILPNVTNQILIRSEFY